MRPRAEIDSATLKRILHDLYPDGHVPDQKVEELRAALSNCIDPVLSFAEFQSCIALRSDLEMWTASLPLSSLIASALSILAPPAGPEADPLQSLAQSPPEHAQAVLGSAAHELSRVVLTALDRLRQPPPPPPCGAAPPASPEAVSKYIFDPDLAGPAAD